MLEHWLFSRGIVNLQNILYSIHMKTKKATRTILFKKTVVVLCVLFGIEILLMTLFEIYDFAFITPRQEDNKTISITAEDIKDKLNDSFEIQPFLELEVLPSDYDTLVKNFGSFTPHELTTYLRYSEVLKNKDTTNLTNGYKYLEDSGLNILIPQTYIDQYILTEVLGISKLITQEAYSDKSTLPYILMNENSSVQGELSRCITNDLDSFLKEATCQPILSKIDNEDLLPTLSFLTTALKYKSPSSANIYDTYIGNHMYLYQMEKVNTLVESSNNSATYTNDTYLDLDQTHIHKAQLITNYLKILNSKLGYSSNKIDSKISDLDNVITSLSEYKYGNDIPTQIKGLANNQLINLSDTENNYAQSNAQISILIKSCNFNDEIKTFMAPMYTFRGKDDQPVSALEFEINDNNFDEDYDITPTVQAKGTVRLPIFMYHQITQVPVGQSSFKSGLYVDPLDFEKEMAYLVKKNYKAINSYEYSNILQRGKNPTQKTVMLTFDDGVLNQYTTAYPILKKYGLTGVFYIISEKSAINQAQTKEMSDNGMDIGSHSARHPDLTKVTDPAQLSAEIISSKSSLQNATGKTIYSFAYPGCGWNSQTLSYVSSAGYAIAVSCGSSIDNYPAYNLVLSRVHAFGDMGSFKNLLSGVR